LILIEVNNITSTSANFVQQISRRANSSL